MRHTCILTSIALTLVSCGGAPPDFRGTPEHEASFLARWYSIRDVVGPDKTINAFLLAEGSVLVVHLDGAVIGNMSELRLIRELRPRACALGELKTFIGDGGRVRYELANTTGQAQPPATIAYCPDSNSVG